MTRKKPHPSAGSASASPSALLSRAVQLFNSGQPAQAAPLCEELVRLQPDNANGWQLLGMTYIALERPAAALPALQQALALQPGHTQILCLLGTASARADQAPQAIAYFRQALALAPGDPNVWYDLANVQHQMGQPAAALASYNQAVALAPQHADAWFNRAHVLLALRQPAEAVVSLRNVVFAAPAKLDAWLLMGTALQDLQRLPESLECFEKVIELDPKHLDGWLRLGTALEQLGAPDLAIERLRTAERLAPDSPQVLLALAVALSKVEGDIAALAPLQRAYALAPDDLAIALQLLHVMLKTACWDSLPPLLTKLATLSRAGAGASNTISMLAHPDVTARDLLQANRAFHAGFDLQRPVVTGRQAAAASAARAQRLRIGYLSSDLRHHAVTFLMAGVFEAHDRAQFETFAFSTYPQPDDSPERRRVLAAVEHFIDIHALGDDDAAALIAGHRIDVLVDLNGLTGHSRAGILARRPAPVQVQYLGYPGTIGLAAIDYIIGDRWVTPAEQAEAFSEHIVRLPESFQANDDQRRIAPDTPSRSALGLPAEGFVFCCLNNAYKILPQVFDVWMRLLTQTPGAVLWLLGESQAARDNLRAHAQARGVTPERLVFAERRPYAEYLAQYRQADLFLDTLPFNGGTTVSDALWVGLPVLTQAGNRFAGRMAASLLDNLGLPELITHTAAEYEALGQRLANEPALLQGLRARLAANLRTAPLFDTRRFTRHLESAYLQMAERHAQGLPPAAFDVAALPRGAP